jgi:uncharacterized protein (DUF2249 family)
MTDAEAAMIATIDVRIIPPFERHPRIFGMLKTLKADESFMVVSDHEPRPLHYQIQTNYPGLFSWEYLEQGPEVWRVKITREASSGCECCCGS